MYRLFFSIETNTEAGLISDWQQCETIQEAIQFWNGIVDRLGDDVYFTEIVQVSPCSNEDLLRFCHATGEEYEC